MKVLTVSGTRPDFIRLIPTIRKLDKYFDHKLVWAGQNYEDCLSTQFFKEFNREPDIGFFNEKARDLEYVGLVMKWLGGVYDSEKPDCVLVLGDTHASFAAVYTAKRRGIVVFHMEAGNRCYDPARVPEEVNRYMVDAVADWHLCYTQRAREQLLLEGKKPDRVVVVGNPIVEAIEDNAPEIKLGEDYYLVTLHRKENLNDPKRLFKILTALEQLTMNCDIKVFISNHPSLKASMERGRLPSPKALTFIEPKNFGGFLQLEQNAVCVITDSGTVPEECHILKTPCVLIRYSTERPELLESNDMVVCSNPDDLYTAIRIARSERVNRPIPEYHSRVSSNVVKILMRWNQSISR